MGQFYSTHYKYFYIIESFYIIELNLVLFLGTKTEFFPRTMEISQKVSKMGDIARNVQQKMENVYTFTYTSHNH